MAYDPDTAIYQEANCTLQVIYVHRNIPGVLRKVNEIFGDHNVDKQISDSRGDVSRNTILTLLTGY